MRSEIRLKKNLQYLVKDKKWSLSFLARRSKMHKSTLHGYLSGVVPRGLENLVLLAEALEIEPGTLLFGDLKVETGPLTHQVINSKTAYEIIIRPLSNKNEEENGLS